MRGILRGETETRKKLLKDHLIVSAMTMLKKTNVNAVYKKVNLLFRPLITPTKGTDNL